MAHADPFNLVRDEVSKAVDETVGQLAAVKAMRSSSGSGAGGSSRDGLYGAAKRELQSMVESAVWQVDELSRAVDVSERDPSRFRLDSREVRKRREWVEGAKMKLVKVKRELDSDKHPASDSMSSRGRSQAAAFSLSDDYADDEADFDTQEANQRLLMREQDDDLENISTSLHRIGQYGLAIGEELRQQDEMLNDLDEDVNTTQARLDAVQKKMMQVFKKAKSNYQVRMIRVDIIINTLQIFASGSHAPHARARVCV